MDRTQSRAACRLGLDALGATLSLACAIQCAVLPLVISLLPFSLLAVVVPFIPAALLPGGGFDWIALGGASALAAGSFSWGFSRHRRVYIFAFLLAALGVIFAGWLWVAGRYQVLFVVIGAAILTAGHLLNRRLCRAAHARFALETSELENSAA